MDFRYIHAYSNAGLDAKVVAGKIAKAFTKCKVDVRKPFQHDDRVEYAKISDLKQPFESQPKQPEIMMSLYDGFVLQRMFAETIPAKESDHVHIIFTSLLTCTFSEEDWRYHGRAVVCGTPSIVSIPGIVEAPAKPKEFYLAQFGGQLDVASLKKRLAGRFIDYGDKRMTAVCSLYALQALFFFVADGELFCDNRDCLLFNPHWQEELIHLLERGRLCERHMQMANKFNKKFAKR